MFDIKQIAATLKYGYFDGTKRKYIVAAFITITTLCIVGMVGLIYSMCLEQVTDINSLPAFNFIFAIIGIVLGFSFIPLFSLIFIVRNEKMRKEIHLWLEDAVELEAFCKQIGESTETVHELSTSPSKIKIQVNFKYNGKKFSIESGSGKKSNAYQGFWKQYAGKSISILFSPKYNQVMILNQNKQ